MSNFTGVLTITSGNESFLNSDLLLLAGIADPAQAAFAATGFLQANGFGSGDPIVVVGHAGSPVGGVSTIVMTNAFAAQPAIAESLKPFLEMIAPAKEKKTSTKTKGAAAGGQKSATKRVSRPRTANKKKMDKKNSE